jgi:Endosomal/lysosomal potassium channel TMEM175
MAENHKIVIHRGRDLDRLVNFTDAVVAVAITVLVLPIADLAVNPSEPTVWAVLQDNSGHVITFFFTFVVVAVMWRAHNKVFNRLSAFDNRIFWYNLAWLAAIAFLPVTSNLYGSANAAGEHGWSGGSDLGGSGLLYWGSLGMVSIWGTAIAAHAQRHPELTVPTVPTVPTEFQNDTRGQAQSETNPEPVNPVFRDWRIRYRGLAFSGYFFLIGVVSLVSPMLASYMPLGIIIVGRIMR